jgi:hypothetical protein
MHEPPVDRHPVVRPGDLADDVIKGLHSHVIGFEREDTPDLARRQSSKLRHDDFDHEAPTRPEVSCGVAEHRHLLLLRRHVHQGVPHHVHELEIAFDVGSSHVTDRDGHCSTLRLLRQPRSHRC